MLLKKPRISLTAFFNNLNTKKAIWIIVVVGFIVYFNTLFNGFVWDDIGQIVDNSLVHNLSNIGTFFFGLKDASGNTMKIVAIYYRPIMASLFAIIYSTFGPNAFFFHLFSLVLHLLIAVLIFKLFQRFFGQSLSLFLGLIFLVHPLSSEVVNYISAYNDLLYIFFGLCSLFCLKLRLPLKWKIFLTSSLLFLSLLSKESGVLFIPILIIYSILYKKDEIVNVITSLLLSVSTYLILRTSSYTGIPAEKAIGFSPFIDMSLIKHLINIPKIFLYYFGNFFIPINITIAQHWVVTELTFTDFYFPLVILLLFIYLNIYSVVRFYRRKEVKNLKDLLFFSIWFWVGVGFYLQFYPLDMTVADRWFYFGIVGLVGLLGIFINIYLIQKHVRKTYFLIISIVLILLFATRTVVRNSNWSSEYNLYTHDMKVGKPSFDLENQLGIVFYKKGDFKEARAQFQKSVDLWSCSEALNNLGYLSQKEGDFNTAEKYYLKGIDCSGGYKTYSNLVTLLYKTGKYESAEEYALEGIKKFTGSSALYVTVGLIEYKKGYKQNALMYLLKAYELNKDPQVKNIIDNINTNKPVSL